MDLRRSAYSHSGNPGLSLIAAPVVGAIVGVVLATIYAYVTVYFPFVYFNVLFAIGLGIGVGASVVITLVLSKCRSRTVAAVLGAVVGLFTLYASWVLFLFVLMRQADVEFPWSDLPGFFMQPTAVWELVSALSETGWYSLVGGLTPTGVVLWVIWFLEAVLIVGLIGYLAAFGLDEGVFCERCSSWTEPGAEVRLRMPPPKVKAAWFSDGGEEDLLTWPTAAAGKYPQVALTSRACATCASTCTYRLHDVRRGGDDEEVKPLTPHYFVSEEMLRQLLDADARDQELDEVPPAPAP